MSELVKYARNGNVAVVTIDNPPVNALSPGVPEGILDGIETANADPEVGAIVVIGGGRTFIAGADIKEFGKITSGTKPKLALYPALLKIEDSKKPVVMAIHGTAFGGGLEVAMAGHYRVAVAVGAGRAAGSEAGHHSGRGRNAAAAAAGRSRQSGGDVRLRRADRREVRAGVRASSTKSSRAICSTARSSSPREVAGKLAYKTRERNEKLQDASKNITIFAVAREHARKTRRGQTAPLAAIDAVEAATRADPSTTAAIAKPSSSRNACSPPNRRR